MKGERTQWQGLEVSLHLWARSHGEISNGGGGTRHRQCTLRVALYSQAAYFAGGWSGLHSEQWLAQRMGGQDMIGAPVQHWGCWLCHVYLSFSHPSEDIPHKRGLTFFN
eukprot:3464066-Ditylum_brightwellii.AAC.1